MEQRQDESQPGISEKQEKAIAALLAEPTIRRAAATAQVGEATIWRWLRNDQFRKAYLEARRRSVEQANARIQTLTSAAASVLEQLMNDPAQPGATRLAAVKYVLQNAMSGIELEEYSDRLSAIESHVEASADVPSF